MGLINRDPDDVPEFSDAFANEARRLGRQIVAVTLVGDDTQSGFWAMVHNRLNLRDQIQSEDGEFCEVTKIVYRMARTEHGFLLVPNVYAHKLRSEDISESGSV